MTFRIEQENEYLGNKRWRWRTWIDAPESDLARVEKVTWFLHHTFPNPVVETDERARKFAIERTAWGRFQIRAELQLGEGDKQLLDEWLQLAYPSGEGAASKEAPVKAPDPAGAVTPKTNVFLSYGTEDEHLAAKVKGTLEKHGYRILDAHQAKAGEPLNAAVQKMIRESDVVLGLVTSEFASPFLVDELNTARASDKPTVALINADGDLPFGVDRRLARVSLDLNAADPGFDVLSAMEKYAVV